MWEQFRCGMRETEKERDLICRRKSLEMLAEIESERYQDAEGRGEGKREGDEEVDEVDEVDEVKLSYETVAGSSWPTSFRLCFLRGVAAVLSQKISLKSN